MWVLPFAYYPIPFYRVREHIKALMLTEYKAEYKAAESAGGPDCIDIEYRSPLYTHRSMSIEHRTRRLMGAYNESAHSRWRLGRNGNRGLLVTIV